MADVPSLPRTLHAVSGRPAAGMPYGPWPFVPLFRRAKDAEQFARRTAPDCHAITVLRSREDLAGWLGRGDAKAVAIDPPLAGLVRLVSDKTLAAMRRPGAKALRIEFAALPAFLATLD
jgi:hypothetical protein